MSQVEFVKEWVANSTKQFADIPHRHFSNNDKKWHWKKNNVRPKFLIFDENNCNKSFSFILNFYIALQLNWIFLVFLTHRPPLGGLKENNFTISFSFILNFYLAFQLNWLFSLLTHRPPLGGLDENNYNKSFSFILNFFLALQLNWLSLVFIFVEKKTILSNFL